MDVADFVVVGGGMAGVTVAASLAASGSVVVIEQEKALRMHATGKSVAAVLKSYGSATIQALTSISAGLIRDASETAKTSFLRSRPLLRYADVKDAALLEEMAGKSAFLESISPGDALKFCSALRPDAVHAAAIEVDAADVDVGALHDFYVQRLLAQGGRVDVDRRLLGGVYTRQEWRLETSRGPITAATVLIAAGAWADHVGKSLGARSMGVVSKKRTIALASVPGVPDDWPLVLDARETCYFRPYGKGVLLSPADESIHEPGDPQPDPADIMTAVVRLRSVTTLDLSWIYNSWAGLRTFSRDREPIVGWDPDQPALFWLAGQGGYGIQASPAIGQLSSAILCGGVIHQYQKRGVSLARLDPARFQESSQ